MSMSRQQRRELERKQRKADRREMNAPPVAATPITGPTGPRTEEGKAVSCQNALRHGLTAARLVMPWESQADYDHLLAQLLADHDPQNATETIYVNEMAEQWWRLQRARNEEYRVEVRATQIISDPNSSDDMVLEADRMLSKVRRYSTSFERAFHRAHRMLRSLQKERAEREETTPAPAPIKAQAKAEPPSPKPQPPQVEKFVSQNGSAQLLTAAEITVEAEPHHCRQAA